ncbi:MAG: acyl-CoA dehydrogenase family protein [Acidimicrobiia bacterium]|nr:acyl-CoA dehydrogenase family protein [Acidimicrobiia bacterium]
MDFTLSSDQQALQEAVRKLCEGRFPMERVRALADVGGVDRALWRELADAGVFSLRLAEGDGGAGLGTAEAALVFEELGRALVPGPLVWTHLAAGFVPGAAEGDTVVGGLQRQEEPFLVEYPDAIDVLVAVDDDGLWEVDRSRLSARPVAWPLDPLTPVHVAGGLLRGERRGVPGDASRWRLEGAVLTAAFLLGMSAALTELSVDYAKQRQQFEKPIGSFQAIKHLLADMFVRTEVARSAVYAAAVTLDQPALGPPARAVSGAKLLAGEAATVNGKTATQVFGGMGFTWEVDVHLYVKRAWVLETVFGSGDAHADTVADLLGGYR